MLKRKVKIIVGSSGIIASCIMGDIIAMDESTLSNIPAKTNENDPHSSPQKTVDNLTFPNNLCPKELNRDMIEMRRIPHLNYQKYESFNDDGIKWTIDISSYRQLHKDFWSVTKVPISKYLRGPYELEKTITRPSSANPNFERVECYYKTKIKIEETEKFHEEDNDIRDDIGDGYFRFFISTYIKQNQ